MSSLKMSSKTRQGFTMVEVILFLSLSAAILIGLIAGTSSSISRQRYNDAIQDFDSFLQRQYSNVLNVQNSLAAGGGQSSTHAIYGRLLVFPGEPADNGSEVHAWNVVGRAISSSEMSAESLTTWEALADIDLRVACATTETYVTQWGSTIETIAEDHTRFVGSVLIVRSPISGVIYTYYSDQQVFDPNSPTACGGTGVSNSGIWQNDLGNLNFSVTDIDFCLANSDGLYGGNRRNIRIAADNHSISSISLIPLDDPSQNRCRQ